MRQRPEFRWWLVSLAVHAAVLAVLAVALRNPGFLPWVTTDDPPRADTVTIRWPDIPAPDPGAAAVRAAPPGPPAFGALPAAGQAAAASLSLRDTAFAGIDLGPLEGEVVPPVSVTPGFGDGRLWVRPGAVVARGGAPGREPVGGVSAPLDPEVHAARIDSALAVRILAYLDTLPPDSFAYDMRPPSWTAEVDGRTWGIDQQWIYLGDFKLPTMLLGLLPIGGQGNWEQGRRTAELQRIREDILRAAARASDAADFRRYVNELRERREAERRQDRDQQNE